MLSCGPINIAANTKIAAMVRKLLSIILQVIWLVMDMYE